jgi:hypothetical protein
MPKTKMYDVDYLGLRDTLRHGVQNWLEAGIQPGSFLSAVISNDLKEAFNRADAENLRNMYSIVKWFYNKCPESAWGSIAKAKAWAAQFEQVFDGFD